MFTIYTHSLTYSAHLCAALSLSNQKLKHIKAECKSKPQYNQLTENKNKACNLKTRKPVLFNKNTN